MHDPVPAVISVEMFERERRFRALVREKREWAARYGLGYECNWDTRAMNMIVKELNRLRRELIDEFGYHC